MQFYPLALLALASHASANVFSDFLATAGADATDAAAQAAFLSEFAALSGGDFSTYDVSQLGSYLTAIPTSLDALAQSVFDAISAAQATGAPDTEGLSAASDMDMNSSEMADMMSTTAASGAASGSAASGGKSASKSATSSGSSGESLSSSGLAGKEGPMFIGAALVGLSVLLL